MYFKTFTRLFLLIGMIGLFSATSIAEEITIGSYSTTDPNLPSHSYYKYSLTQQIYTATEIEDAGGGAGTINSIAFYNGGSTKTRNFSIYLVNTDKESFSNSTDWITVTANDLVFSGNVEMTANVWTTITFSNPFTYDGGNLAVVVDDNTGNDVSGMSCRVYTASSTQSIYYRNDYTNPNPTNPTISGTPTTSKNQIILDIEMAAVTCAKPKNFNAESITAHEATLTWTAGGEESNWDVYVTTDSEVVPDDNTTPTYQVTSCSKDLAGLTAQTTYYTYVRANCGGGDKSKWAKKVFTTTREALAVDANNPYSQDFETNNDWGFTNGTLTNNWCWGNATNNGGSKAVYVSKDGGATHEYAHSTTVVFASKLFVFAQGAYTFSFDWKANGENNCDYLRVALVPGDMEFTAGTLPSGVGHSALPNTWIALDGGGQLDLKDSWQNQTSEATVNGTYTMVFLWRNDSYGGNQPPAAIDNISISFMTCPRPTNLTASNITGRTATLSWNENGTATNWILQYGTASDFAGATSVSVSGTASKELSGLSPETTYYARVKSVLGSDESSWSDVKSFTTIATCPKPTLSYVSYSATAYTGTVQWAGSTADAFEVAYRPTSDFDPSDYTLENVTRVLLENVSEYNYTLENLTPETKYYIYVQADCGSEDGKSSWSNRVIFTTLETCLPPSGLSTSTTSSTITLSWTAGAEGQDAWDIRYKKNTDSDYTYIHLDNHPTTSYTITGLSPVTTYGVNVRAYCSETDQSKWGASTANQSYDKSVTTACGAIELPYTCDFEGTMQTVNSCKIPSCWSVIKGYHNSTHSYGIPTVANQSTSTQPIAYPHGGTYCLYFLNSTYSGTSEEYAILPEISEEYKMGNVQIRFWVRSNNTSCQMEVGVMADPSNANTYVQVETVEITSTYTEKTISLSNYSGNGHYIALKCPAASMYSQAFYVDDITVEYIPSCQIPDNFDVDEIGVNEATLSWTPRGTETAWNVQYKKVSENEWNEPITVDETTYTLHGLQRATEYEVRVQANCSTDDQSEWTNPISFTTECGIWPIDAHNGLFEDFENVDASDFPPICWEKFSHEMSGYTYWYLNSNNGLGSSAAFSYWNEGYAFLVMPQRYIDGNAILSFDHLISDGSYNGNCSVVVSTETMTYDNFSTTIWEGNGPTSGKASETVSLSAFNGQDIYIAFKYKGAECTWYIDNVQVYVPITQTVELAQGWNWWSPTVEVSLEALETALGTNGITIKSQTEAVIYEDEEWLGDDFTLIPGQMYKIKVSDDCEFNLTGKALYSTTITIEPGYNWFGYTSTLVISVNDAFEDLNPNEGDVIKSLEDSSTFEDGEWIGDITNLQPGHGYVYISHSTENKTITFP